MQRRHFIHAAMSSVVLPAAVKAQSLPALAALLRDHEYAFFDERFAQAQRAIGAWSAANRVIPVQGDVTPIWTSELDRTTRERRLTLQGVTTGSFHFCLRVLLSEHASLDEQMLRLDRNLVVWTLRSTPKSA
jgi:hypothetical protein